MESPEPHSSSRILLEADEGCHAGPNPDVLLAAVRDMARARGITRTAHDAGPGQERLYEALTPEAKARYETVARLLTALGVKLTVEAPHTR